MAYERITNYRHDADPAASSPGSTMIDGLEVVDDQVVVLAPLDAVGSTDRRGSARASRDRRSTGHEPDGTAMAWDSTLGPVSELVEACAGGFEATAGTISLTRLVVDAPIELQSRTHADGTVALEVAPPRQTMETTVMPVLHRIRINVVADR